MQRGRFHALPRLRPREPGRRALLRALRGDEEGFRAELGRARDLAAELGATGHLERLERELASA